MPNPRRCQFCGSRIALRGPCYDIVVRKGSESNPHMLFRMCGRCFTSVDAALYKKRENPYAQ